MPNKGHDIIVIGTSAGGLEALDELIGKLPRICLRPFLSFSTWRRRPTEKPCYAD
jgi:chemotaxis response regulator CheB